MTGRAMSASMVETQSGSRRQPASAVANGDGPQTTDNRENIVTTSEQQAVPVAQEKRRQSLILNLGMTADLCCETPLPGDLGDVAYDLLRQAAAQIASDGQQIARPPLPCKSGEGAGTEGAATPLFCVLADAVHDRLFGVASLQNPALALAEISDNGGIHEAVHQLIRALPPRADKSVDATQTREAELVAALEPWQQLFADLTGRVDEAWFDRFKDATYAARAALNALSCRASDQAIESPNAALNARGGCAQPALSEQDPLGASSSSEDEA